MPEQEYRIVFLKDETVVLRPLCTKTDIPHLARWINDPEIRQYLLITYPQMEENEGEWLKQVAKNDGTNIVLAIETIAGKLIGTMGLHRINWKDRVATTGAIIGEADFRDKGYGTAAKMLLLDYAFNTLNLRKICSSVIAFNERSLQYSLHSGYVIEGRLRQHIFKNGEYHDEINLGVFKEEWLAARKLWIAKRSDTAVAKATNQ
jgi:RimJ/RimL family protein N-acetyltransferase